MVKEPLSKEEIEGLALLTGLGSKELINKRSQVFRKMDINLDDKTEEEATQLMQDNPRIIARPLLTNGQQALLWFSEEGYQEAMDKGWFSQVLPVLR